MVGQSNGKTRDHIFPRRRFESFPFQFFSDHNTQHEKTMRKKLYVVNKDKSRPEKAGNKRLIIGENILTYADLHKLEEVQITIMPDRKGLIIRAPEEGQS